MALDQCNLENRNLGVDKSEEGKPTKSKGQTNISNCCSTKVLTKQKNIPSCSSTKSMGERTTQSCGLERGTHMTQQQKLRLNFEEKNMQKGEEEE